MQTIRSGDRRLHAGWWALILILVLAALVGTSIALFSGTLRAYVPVVLVSDRSGLVMEPGAKVKLNGVQVGRVGEIKGGADGVSLQLQIDPDQLEYIPANVRGQIRATTAFGAKYVDLIYPDRPIDRHVFAGQIIRSENVSTEVNTVFQRLTDVLDKVDPQKLNATLTALAEGLRGQGPIINQATSAANQVLLQLNPRAEIIRKDWRSLKGFSDAFGGAAESIVSILDSATTTSATIIANADNFDALLLGVTGFSQSGIDLLGPSKDNLTVGINALQSTTSLLMKYNPELTCMLVGGYNVLNDGGYDAQGANGYSTVLDTAILLGDDPYRYPDNLPIVGAKGGPGGKPGCGSLPDAAKNFPVRQLVTNTGWGTGLDLRPNPGIGFPGYENYFPVTRATPEPPSIRYPGGPAPGPDGGPPYGAPLYAPDGTPLFPGLPPAPPPGAPRDAGPTPGSEPLTVGLPTQPPPAP